MTNSLTTAILASLVAIWLTSENALAQPVTPISIEATLRCGEQTGDWIGCVGKSAELCTKQSRYDVPEGGFHTFRDAFAKDRFECQPDLQLKAKPVLERQCYDLERWLWETELTRRIGHIRDQTIRDRTIDLRPRLDAIVKFEAYVKDSSMCVMLYQPLGYDPNEMPMIIEMSLCRARQLMGLLMAFDWTLEAQVLQKQAEPQ